MGIACGLYVTLCFCRTTTSDATDDVDAVESGTDPMTAMNLRALAVIAGAVALTLPWVARNLFGIQLATIATVVVSGIAVLGAAFLLAWAAETAEKDVPRAFAIAVLAVLAVAPEYAVDALYAWNAGQFAGTPRGIEAGNLAVANMTGANRILIGIGWAGIALFALVRHRRSTDPTVRERPGVLADAVSLDRDIGLDVVFLLAATLWAFFIPLNGGIDGIDMVVLVGLYVGYLLVILQGDVEPQEGHGGVPAWLQQFSTHRRIATVLILFAYSGVMIFTAVEPFAHGLETLGTQVGLPAFFMIQWIAPLASESPELIVVVYLVNKARSTAGFNALISSKLNQWTLLIGTLVLVYSIGLGQFGPLPFDQKQTGEIWLTAAQSLFAIAVLVDFEISGREALVLLVLFSSQVAAEFLIIRGLLPADISSYELLLVFSGIYIAFALALFTLRRNDLARLLSRTGERIAAALFPIEREQPTRSD